ncbi:Alpha/Beta hydrolase protein [Massariosphaeria phaeospora]|uniref:Alpha/Beta hydrolase protein n=1 Tax=Massariosphaeria phaeospora TaxID=100035 RepID=A0A7C8M9I9_9PLEO|nr:Alpha/Beta hydrolase protein [Massariosphaeria phaeospora]
MAVQWPDESMFNNFTVFKESFKTVGSHDIGAAILVPKNVQPGKRPVIVNLHGGFLVNGHSLFAPFFSPWVLKLALEESAVVISGDYRLLPTANGVADQLEDIEDFWQWTRNKLPAIFEGRAPGFSLDLTRLLLAGSSAGGYCAVQLGLSHPEEISAMAMAYPFVNPADEVIVNGPKDGEPTILRFPLDTLPSKEAVVAWIDESRKEVTSQADMDRGAFAAAAAQYGLYYSHLFDNRSLKRPEFLPLLRIKAGAKLPPKIWILTGDDDSVVYLRTIQEFVDLSREKLPRTTIRLDIAPGEDHAFDHTKSTWELHAIGAMGFVKQSWLGI